MLKIPSSGGVNGLMPYFIIKNNAPKIIKNIETNLTIIIIACITFVF
jgi:hypothetical protein